MWHALVKMGRPGVNFHDVSRRRRACVKPRRIETSEGDRGDIWQNQQAHTRWRVKNNGGVMTLKQAGENRRRTGGVVMTCVAIRIASWSGVSGINYAAFWKRSPLLKRSCQLWRRSRGKLALRPAGRQHRATSASKKSTFQCPMPKQRWWHRLSGGIIEKQNW